MNRELKHLVEQYQLVVNTSTRSRASKAKYSNIIRKRYNAILRYLLDNQEYNLLEIRINFTELYSLLRNNK